MTTVQDLRAVLAEHAGPAEHDETVLAGARAGAARIRRRRRVLAAAAAVVVVAGTAPLLTLLPHETRPAAPPAAASEPAREPSGPRTVGSQTVGLRPDPALRIGRVVSRADLQTMEVRGSSATRPGGVVVVHDPGTFQPSRADLAEPTTVAGRTAYFGAGPRLTWQVPSGSWVVAEVEGDDRAALRRMAELVEVGGRRPITGPVQVHRLPADLAAVMVSRVHAGADGYVSMVGLGRGKPSLVVVRTIAARTRPVVKGDPAAPVAGHPATELRTPRPMLTVRAGTCVVQMHSTSDAVDAAGLRRIAENATYGDCERPETWQPIIGG